VVSDRSLALRLLKVVHIDEDGADVALFEIERGPKLPPAIRLAAQPPMQGTYVGAIGYPADPQSLAPDEMHRYFRETYDKKRLALGTVIRVDAQRIEHDCTTLGGSAGSVLIDLATGEAVGLHSRGTFLDRNYAIRADVVRRLLDDVVGESRRLERGTEPEIPERAANSSIAGGTSVTVTIPVTITVEIGKPVKE
jgi:endonuclease G